MGVNRITSTLGETKGPRQTGVSGGTGREDKIKPSEG